MIYALLTLTLVVAVYFPAFWVRYSMHQHSKELANLPGTGGELAKHLVKRFELNGVVVEQTETMGDHFSPTDNAVRLSPANYAGRSLTAVAVAAHEVGHAIQFTRQERVAELRVRYLPTATRLKKLGVGLLIVVPFLAAFSG